MDFAKSQLVKHGWTSGSGLGKHEDGIKEPISATKKLKNTGVGYDMSSEFKDHWWDRVFNDAASSVTVSNTPEEVVLQCNPKPRKEHRKRKLYGKFTKGGTLENGQTKTESSDSEDKVDETSNPVTGRLLADHMWSMCDGRTAHKGARHGIKSGGKLDRIAEQERTFTSTTKKLKPCQSNKESVDSKSDTTTKTRSKRKKTQDLQIIIEDNVDLSKNSNTDREKHKHGTGKQTKCKHIVQKNNNLL